MFCLNGITVGKMTLRHGLFCGEPLLIDGFSLHVFVMSCFFMMLCYLSLRMIGQPDNFSVKYLVFRSHTARNQPWHKWSNSKPYPSRCCYCDVYVLINKLVRSLISQVTDWLIYRFVQSFRSIRSKWWSLAMASWHLWSSSSAFWWGLGRPVQPWLVILYITGPELVRNQYDFGSSNWVPASSGWSVKYVYKEYRDCVNINMLYYQL